MMLLKAAFGLAVMLTAFWFLRAIWKLDQRVTRREALEARHKQRMANMQSKGRELQARELERVTGGGQDV